MTDQIRLLNALVCLFSMHLLAGGVPVATPVVYLLDTQCLASAKARLEEQDAALQPAVDRLLREADKALKEQPGSVMDKARVPPSGDKHDYLSLAPYAWPDPSKPDGLPWITRDGETNPESRAGTDHNALGKMYGQVDTLALAWYFSGKEEYAEKTATILKVWFLDPATKMNPSLEYAQGIPGKTTGRGTGIIDTYHFVSLPDSIGLLEGSKAWPPELRSAMQEWFRAYLRWLLSSKNGLDEAKTANNHGTWFLSQTAVYALFAGDTELVRRQVEQGWSRIASQIEPDGRQPLELKRTRSYSYTLFNLDALFTLAEAGRRVQVDLFQYRTPDGRSLRGALDYIAPYFDPAKKWPGKQITPVKPPDQNLGGFLKRAARLYPDGPYSELLTKGDPTELAKCRFHLLWPR